jgi:hemerythrin
MLLTWGPGYSVGVPAMDIQHRALFGMLNELHDAMLTGRGQQATRLLLKRLVDYTRDHFAAEEKAMSAAGYPELGKHRAEHQALTRRVQEYVVRLESSEAAINLHLLTFLREWLSKHIQQTDKEYGPWVSGKQEVLEECSAA